MGKLKILPTIVDMFAGLNGLSKGDSMVVPGPQVAMKTLPTLGDSPAQMYSTGSVSLGSGAYLECKTGQKAEFNHSLGALIVELGKGDSFHVRQLNCDEKSGFYDCRKGLEGYFNKDGFKPLDRIEALYAGDTHASVSDDLVIKATYTAADSICNVLRPKQVVHGDLMSTTTVSHHDEHDYLRRIAKHAAGKASLEDEFNTTMDLLRKITPADTVVNIISSNHNDHVYKYLTTINPHKDLVNAKIYHKLMYLMIEAVEKSADKETYPNLMQLWIANSQYADMLDMLRFHGRRASFAIMGIECGMHGDKGANGAKGSPNGFSMLPTKCIVGHSHSPSIRLGCYTVGTTSRKDLPYTGGPSSWMHSHCIIYPNGKRQMINVINGKWRAD